MTQIPARRRCCLNCHFLMQWTREDDGGDLKFEVPKKHRERLAAGESDSNMRGDAWSIACFQDVWDWANRRPESSDDLPEVLSLDRGESCFFYPHTLGMFFGAATELERRVANRREAKRDRKIAKWSIIIGLAGVFLGAVLTKIFS